MNVDDLIKGTGEWVKGSGANADIVISSRVRLARNIMEFPFPNRASGEQKKKVADAVLAAAAHCFPLKNALVLGVEELTPVDKQFLAERHLVSLEFVESEKHAKVVIGDREMIAIMVNEEDHVRLQTIQSGLQLVDAWKLADDVDNELSRHVRFACSSSWGYLTACPTNAGTGMRASVMLHLPGLVTTKQIIKVIQAITKLGIVARGLYGEGTEPSGNLFQISNQITLGRTEDDTVDDIERIGKQVVEHEQKARDLLLTKGRMELEDKVFRAYGILQNVRIITSSETLDLLSSLRLGVDMGLIRDVNQRTVNELLVLTQPAHLQKMEGRELSPEERDVRRASLTRRKLQRGAVQGGAPVE